MPVDMGAAGAVAQTLIVHFPGTKGVTDRFGHQGHFLQVLCPDSRGQVEELHNVLLIDKQGIAFKMLEIPDDHITGFQFFDKIRIPAFPGHLDSFAYTAHILISL